MNNIKTGPTINLKDREEMSQDPFYQTCALYGQHGHECGGKITWEHALKYAGKKLQEIWAIIPICEKAHAVNSFQDAGTMNKEMNVWVALNRATDEQLEAISKAESYLQKRVYLNSIYGEYVHKVPTNCGHLKETKKNWIPLDDRHYGMLLDIRKKNKENLGINYGPWDTLNLLIEQNHEEITQQESENFNANKELLECG